MTTSSFHYINPPANVTGNPDLDELNSLLEVVDSHDDRGLVLSLAAFAEDTLGRLLIAYLREEKQAKELVEGFNAPLGTFSARIKVAFSLGLLHREQYDNLEILRRIRNSFAHNWQGISFDRNDISALIGQLHKPLTLREDSIDDERNRLREAITGVVIEIRLLLKDLSNYP
jgi:DNA-binding MltR family transcriptional regulator